MFNKERFPSDSGKVLNDLQSSPTFNSSKEEILPINSGKTANESQFAIFKLFKEERFTRFSGSVVNE